jgi:membrane-associated phospholipid phosphatase
MRPSFLVGIVLCAWPTVSYAGDPPLTPMTGLPESVPPRAALIASEAAGSVSDPPASARATSPAAAPRVTDPPVRPWDPRPLADGQHFTVDPVTDGVLIGGGGSVAGLLSLILSTGEIKPSLPGPTSTLLVFDRLAVTQHIDPHAGTYSDITLWAAVGFAALDPFLSASRDGWDAALVDAIMYAETISLTEALTDLTKIAVRRPRPLDYVTCPYGVASTATSPACTGNTDLQLSFFSGHSSTVASIGATATYLAFQRGGVRSPRSWLTLVTSIGMSTFVSIERVRAGEHFPTDVLAGVFAGAMVGILVPHFHRHAQEAPPVWLGFIPAPGGGSLTLGGRF